ncbi:flagellar protein FliT [Virgibacillus sp. MSJ-26]|uniref:flagellar protein FliT n=1 Tax=Virgibacillus sp. MSJ-26 TaxID=2841522 RepID=UPI001C118926|nr:flagellar protein FliT [Virgibacillus sp. MSJ-26]MBU5467789.1 flagellar protein FliT [Virgibacillus sp. MSJ-26]
MNRLEELYEATQQLETLLSKDVNVNNREQVIEKINTLVEKRGKYMEDLVPPYSESEKAMGEKLLVLNHHIQEKLNVLFEDLKDEMKQVKKQKKSNQSYSNPYKKMEAIDGMFMDLKE